MRSTTVNYRRLPEIPIEIWAHVFSFFSDSKEATRSDADTWANITRSSDILHDPRNFYARERIAENVQTKAALSRVSQVFRRLVLPLLFELIDVRSHRQLTALCRSARSSPEFASCLTQYTVRLDVIFDCDDEGNADENALIESLGQGWVRDVELVVRACPRMKFVSWDALYKSYAPVDLFLLLPTTCPNIEVLFWKCRSHVDASALNRFLNLRVFYLDSNGVPFMDRCAAIDLPCLHTLGSSVTLVTAVLYQSRMPKLRTLLIDDPNSQHPRFAFLTIHGAKITSLRNLSLLSSGLPFESLCPNIEDLVVRLEDVEELTRLSWPCLRRLGVHLARAPQRLDVETLLFVLRQVENSRSDGKIPELEEIKVMDASIVKRLRMEASMAARLVARRIGGWHICLLDHEGGSLLPSQT